MQRLSKRSAVLLLASMEWWASAGEVTDPRERSERGVVARVRPKFP